MYFSSTKVLIGDTILLMETGPPFYIVIRAARRSSRLQAKEVPLFLSCFKPLTVPEYWSGPPESNQRPCSAVRCSTGLAHPLHPLLSFSPSDRCFLPDWNFYDCLFLKCYPPKSSSLCTDAPSPKKKSGGQEGREGASEHSSKSSSLTTCGLNS